jgi:hypothetical protein
MPYRQRQKDVCITETSGVNGGGEALFQMKNYLSHQAVALQ